MESNQLQVMDLPSSTQAERDAHSQRLLELESRKLASSLQDVPTLPHLVVTALRARGHPVRLFGENNANVRDRLRLVLARAEIQKGTTNVLQEQPLSSSINKEGEEEEQTSTKYTYASAELIASREHIAIYSLERTRSRLQRERKRRWGAGKRKRLLNVSDSKLGIPSLIPWNDADEETEEDIISELNDLDDNCRILYNKLRNTALEGSQYGDGRPLSAICASRTYSDISSKYKNCESLIATGGWSGSIKLWDGSSSALNLLSTRMMAHEDRIMGIAMRPFDNDISSTSDSKLTAMLGTASIDLTGMLWNVRKNIQNEKEDAMEDDSSDIISSNTCFSIEAVGTLKGHQARLCKIAFHPSGRYVGTTSFDHTWRLWDISSGGKELLLQDGHWKEVYGIGFHHDGSLVSTTDFGSVVQVWDLRSGKSACHFLGHARRVLCTEFSPNGFQMATAGDDGTIKIWDLRQRKQYASIPAHSRLITQLKYARDDNKQNGEYLMSCSFDGTAKVWSTRDYKLLSTLRGHEGKVMGVDGLDGENGGIVTCGYDKTMKIWR